MLAFILQKCRFVQCRLVDDPFPVDADSSVVSWCGPRGRSFIQSVVLTRSAIWCSTQLLHTMPSTSPVLFCWFGLVRPIVPTVCCSFTSSRTSYSVWDATDQKSCGNAARHIGLNNHQNQMGLLTMHPSQSWCQNWFLKCHVQLLSSVMFNSWPCLGNKYFQHETMHSPFLCHNNETRPVRGLQMGHKWLLQHLLKSALQRLTFRRKKQCSQGFIFYIQSKTTALYTSFWPLFQKKVRSEVVQTMQRDLEETRSYTVGGSWPYTDCYVIEWLPWLPLVASNSLQMCFYQPDFTWGTGRKNRLRCRALPNHICHTKYDSGEAKGEEENDRVRKKVSECDKTEGMPLLLQQLSGQMPWNSFCLWAGMFLLVTQHTYWLVRYMECVHMKAGTGIPPVYSVGPV